MVELTPYGLTGLTAILVIAFCFAYADEFLRTREKSSCDLINDPHVNHPTLAETGHDAPYSGSLRNDRGILEALHG